VQAPFGNCTFSPDYAKIAFIIGGIGITPVISIIENIAYNKFSAEMALFYSNKNDGNIAFRKELDAWSAENNSLLKVFYAITDCPPRDPSCFYGRIDRGFIESRDAAFKERMIFIFGPPVMVRAMDELCREIGCPAGMVRKESFTGY
jgi:ferredoxin-NADP reductase